MGKLTYKLCSYQLAKIVSNKIFMRSKEYLDFYKNKRVFITGHTGFKGIWLTNTLLTIGAKVAGYSLRDKKIFIYKKNCNYKKVKNIYANILNLKKIKSEILKFKPQIIFHLAAQSLVIKSIKNPKNTIETNLNGTLNILEACRNYNFIKSAVIITSDKCYLNKEIYQGYKESDVLGGDDPYSASKASAELIYHAYNETFFKKKNIGIATTRAGNVIGGVDWSENRIVPDIIKSIKYKKKLTIRNPLSTRPWQHVLEPINGYLLLGFKLFKNPKKFSQPWNFGPKGNQVKNVKNLVKDFNKYMPPFKLKVNFKKVSQFNEAKLLKLNSNKSYKYLKWNCKWTMEQAIYQTALWYKNFLLKKDPITLTKKQIKHYFGLS